MGLNKRDYSESEEAGPRLGGEMHAMSLQQRLDSKRIENAYRLMEKRTQFFPK